MEEGGGEGYSENSEKSSYWYNNRKGLTITKKDMWIKIGRYLRKIDQ